MPHALHDRGRSGRPAGGAGSSATRTSGSIRAAMRGVESRACARPRVGPMDKFTDSRGRPWPGRGPRRARAIAVGVLLAALGAVLRFALTARSGLGLDVHVVGVILILVGLAVMLLPGA